MSDDDNIYQVDYEIDESESESERDIPIDFSPPHPLFMHGQEIDNTDEMYSDRGRKRTADHLCLSERIDEVEGSGGDADQTSEALIYWPDDLLPNALFQVPSLSLTSDVSGSVSPPKKLKLNPATERFFWLKKSVMSPPEMTLSERSAKSLAVSWADAGEVEAQMKDLETSNMSLVFKAEVAVHLKGHMLAAFLRREGGLEPLMQQCWPEVFQRLLTSVYLEIARIDQEPGARQALSRCVRLFREKVETNVTFHAAVHRLGLSEYYPQNKMLDHDEKCLLDYYQLQDHRRPVLLPVPPLHYPLPYSLRNIDRAATQLFIHTCYELSPALRQRQQLWKGEAGRDASESATVEKEEKGLALSKQSAEFRQTSYPEYAHWLQIENQSMFRRHLLLLQSMIFSFINGAFQAALVMCVLAMTDPFYSSSRMTLENRQRAPLLRPIRADIYRYMALCLSWLHADLDLPLACLEMMKKHFSDQLQPLCLGDRGRLVITQMEIFVRYGYHRPARDLFWHWFGRFPSTSWLHQELVLLYTAGALNVIQEELMELKLTVILHDRCRDQDLNDKGCWKKHVAPILRSCKTKMLLLKSILLRCLSDLTLGEDFRRDLNNALTVCQVYLLIHKKVDARDYAPDSNYFHHLYSRLRWNDGFDDSHHLQAFLRPIPRDVTSESSWAYTKRTELTKILKTRLAHFTKQENPRGYADALFTLLAGSLFFDNHTNNRELIQETQTAYIKSTAGRHQRVAILTRLLVLYDNPDEAELPENLSADFSKEEVRIQAGLADPAPSLVHPNISLENLTGRSTVQRRIDEFAVDTLRDALRGFRRNDLVNEEKLIAYLRRRDSLTDVHLDVGLQMLRFARFI